ncbi:CGNR zinc finger domain-containing protein [Cryptosporangium aurantiacum]|uniref:CGNR zinc finger domain-containing protein n=1 Tax=Cryptosporangium aurantiacum TaxID=134849 RepID=A0A1M7RMW4_9ACTN|nr:CGNR zinc finger domain-containing protein [Cryptosporangium aurantiacum]SHN47406.1 CGNR zinc finger domain-containing protein [Cryptosporangium aurantiacum]
MEYDTYNADAVQLAVDLANLVPARDVAGEGLREACETFVATHLDWFSELAAVPLSDVDVVEISALSRSLRDVAGASSDAESVERLDALLQRCKPVPRATNHDGRMHLHYSDDDAPVVEQLGATVSMAMANLIVRHGRERIGICAAADCADVFVDTSRNRSRRYCSETCASRTTVSAYRARRKAAR